jgi:hypothetical protein
VITTTQRRPRHCLASCRSTGHPQDTILPPETSATGPPDADFVLYYDADAPYFDGFVRIGEFDGDKEAITLLPEGADVTIERAE